ncbi:hypothetical protein KC315_g10296 [Hortaea werneckii]|uniref:Methylated-DNA--protein-cysteine methyltransferase n=1 Tax=Hortaea werneckii TaxID=91943 RepID=A0A3M7BX43_HORWE|nr:hypothetical protein KC315_g10296 [Hortaea werneckii]KAI7359843.1 hypothetical protein KC354_g9169 [Hortaea werneckii]KAI7545755.1 hypothetical protein KC331_g6028 [Hortaea werneckii]KAI7716163.1 hypothetical protein KC353_g5579 [Hortaea werneckii]RMY44030.1 hypothetical protein D0865_10832 [Hortaea werneckii]
MTENSSQDIERLRERWNELYKQRLPALAKARDPVQTTWPVFLDHCFARIVLDNAIGKDKPWTEIIKQPAVKDMSEDQLKTAIDLAERLASGKADLVALDERSLELRGKRSKKRRGEDNNPRSSPKKRKPDTGTISSYFLPSPSSPPKSSNSESKPQQAQTTPNPPNPKDSEPSSSSTEEQINMHPHLHRIATSTTLTPFRKQTLSLLCQIPRGQYTTYAALADYISRTSHKTCARAVGNAMRNNPFAPAVPCHRVLAADGSLGGFGGEWGREGKFADEKERLLRGEGVEFDGKGRVRGRAFRGFEG